MYSLVLVFSFKLTLVSTVSSYYLYENRLATFPRPDFNTSFVLRSRKGTKSFKEIRHGLGVDPFYVRVYASPKSGLNKGFVFEGVGVNHVDANYTSYGGVIFAYNSEYIRIWAPNSPSGYIVFVKDGWGGEKSAQQTSKAIVFVQIWKSGPEPNFEIETVIGNGTSSGSFKEVFHQLRQIPDRVLVRVSPESPVNSVRNPNGGYWFHASSSSQNSYRNTSYGGVIFAYNYLSIRLWTPDIKLKYCGCILIDSDWGDGRYNQRETKCRIHVKVWVNAFPLPSYQTDWFKMQAQTIESFKTIQHDLNMVPSYVLVQTRPLTGMNYHFVFEAQGSVQADDDSDDYGGIIFAYNDNFIRLWTPAKNDGTKKGYGVLVKRGWGDNRFLQIGDDKIEVRVKLYSTKCDHKTAASFPSNSCVKTQYNTYTWLTSSWSNCSSICNKGEKERHSTGCLVKSKGKIAKGSCDFETDLCGWSTTSLTVRSMVWKRTNTSTPTPQTGPLWGHPKGSFYIYTFSESVYPHGEGVLTSPNIQGARGCHLTFFWNMHGADIGELNVEINQDWNSNKDSEKGWKNTGWSMLGSHGRAYWRSAYINLEQYIRIYHIRFRHVLPEKPSYCKDRCHQCKECEICSANSCLYGNVAVDNIELWCEASHNFTNNNECKSRIGPFGGCGQPSVIPERHKHLRGPAYSEQVVDYRKKGLRTFVLTNGVKNDIVAKYFINIAYQQNYNLWISTFNTNKTNYAIQFQIDEGDWHNMTTTLKTTHHLWVNYRTKSFYLKPGLHSVTFRQWSLHFRFDQVALSPTKLSTWVDLGLQNYHIPDSYLTAYPPRGSRPQPKHGRLNDKEAWCSTDHNKNLNYFEIKLPNLAILSRIAVQGAENLEQKSNNYWTKSFKLKVSIDYGDHYTWYRNRTGEMKFKGNSDSSSIVATELPYAVPVHAVRIYPQEFFSWVCLRAELYGMYLSSASCAFAGPELPTTKPCIGDRDCGKNADCQKPQSTSTIKKKIGDLWQKLLSPSSNSSTDEYCTCFDGYHGASCQHYGCKPNPCLNNGKCKQASQNGTYYCTCPPGYYGNICQMSCSHGYYGYNCSQVCKCSNHSTCNQVTGNCNCYRGYTGKHCKVKCADGLFGTGCSQKCQCKNNASCNHVDGHCNCTVGWTGKFCQDQCPLTTWGMSCRQNCSCSKSALECNRKTGECICEDGHYGRYCEKSCPVGTYGGNCTQTCQCAKKSQCSIKDGTCNCTEPGLTGLLCDQPCPYGLYGVNCRLKCLCKNNADCDGKTGKCTCRYGWLGKSCDRLCPQGSWGLNCSQKCSCFNGAKCNSSTGQCSCTSKNNCSCRAGFTGSDCTVPCDLGKWGVGCSKTCTCKNNGACDPVTGQCLCLPGFYGNNCETPCVLGYYGNNCSIPCNCNTSVSSQCDTITGACTCLPGRQGAKCDISCSKGSLGLRCNQSCRCIHGSCHPITGRCSCDKGWKGTLCNQPCNNCGQPCPLCYHGNCSTVKGKCICDAGYVGSSCLESCPSGFYGQDCKKKCLCVHGVCRPDSGSCDCSPGWTGTKCDQACPSGRYGYQCLQQCHCINGSCNAVNGSCVCNHGYYSYSCERQCPVGSYGYGCLSKCQCLNGGVCQHVTGRCLCKAGWTGNNCSARCRSGYYGTNCASRCSCKSCDPVTGLCRCPAGWRGTKCTQPCPVGFYGNNCLNKCLCLNGGFCNHIDGSCSCLPGWTGLKCQEPCLPGHFGMQCASPCACGVNVTELSRPCHHVTGDCKCRPGYYGTKCIDQCPSGFYGKNCTSSCKCQNNGACSFIDGSCTCPPGYYGQHCEIECPAGRFGVNCSSTCQCVAGNTMTCSQFTGSCSCKPGYIGVKCENRCPEGKYGAGCHSSCLCQNSAHCDHATGMCLCSAGFKGRYCGQTCDGFTFGPSCKEKCLCENGARCNPVSGSCICSPGYIGGRCSNACLEGRFGINCSKICDCNPSNTKTCSHRNGMCHCMPGYTHQRCDQLCPDGTYGQDCKTPCPQCSRHISGPCNKHHGNCTCTHGYHGYDCYEDCALTNFGLQCKEKCICRKDMMCYHVDGTCLHYQQGLFTVVVIEAMELFNDIDRIRALKRGIEQIMFTYFDQVTRDNNSVASQEKEQDLDESPSFNLNEMDHSTENRTQQIPKHDFVVRVLDMKSVLITEKLQGTQISCLVMDGRTVINSTDVTLVLKLLPSYKISSAIGARYYTGELYLPPKSSSLPIHLPLIIGVSVGTFLICTILITFKARYCYLKKVKNNSKKAMKDPAEFELLPYVSQGASHLLAFENPYYDVLAVMGLDDDIEEEYSNPLYDDVSLYSADSYNSSTDDSCHKDIVGMVVR